MTILRVRLDQNDIGEAGVLAVNEYRKAVLEKAVQKATNFRGARMFGPFETPIVELQLGDEVEVQHSDD